jgi:hypothetical protein
LVFCTQKMHWRVHSLADTRPPFSTILLFSSELSNNRGTGLSYLRPSWINCFGRWCKASLFPDLFICLFFLCSQLFHCGSYLSLHKAFVLSYHTCTIVSPFLWNIDCPFSKF